MIEFMVESQSIMDKQTINEHYCDLVVAVASETGWTIDHVLDLPPWTLIQFTRSKERINKDMERNNNNEVLNKSKEKVLG